MQKHFKYERGQGIVLIAVMMIAILAILSLAVDGGLTYSERRRAQNAADAGALAGARAMCVTGGGDPVAAAQDYAQRNGIDDLSNIQVNAQQVGVVRSVAVTVTLPYDTFFAGAIGIINPDVGATAEAACYPPCSGSGLLPVAWSCSPPIGGSVSPNCDVDTPNTSGSCRWGIDPMYVVADSNTVDDDIVCAPPGPDPTPPDVDCDLDNDGVDDVEILSGGSRSWLDLDGGGGGASDLVNWVNGGYNGPPLVPHTWFPGQTGVTNSVYQAMENREGDIVSIPVFDTFHKGLNPPLLHANDTIVPTSASAADYFHVMTFATFLVSCVDAPGTSPVPCDAKEWLVNNGTLDANVKTVEGCFLQGLMEGSGKPGECNIDAGAYVLKLIR